MEKSTLSWTMYGPLEDETSVSDPLAFDYFAQQLGNVILPSFTTRTSRARYYSMVAYGLDISQRYAADKYGLYHTKEVLETFKLYEKFWARSVVENYNGKLEERDGKELDFRGKRGAINAYRSGTQSLDFHFLNRQLDLGGLGAYRTSMEDLGLIRDDLSLTNLGRTIAREFLPKQYDDYVVDAIKQEKILLSKGKVSLNSLGDHGKLDLWINSTDSHIEERNLLKTYIIENPKNIVAISYIVKENNRLLEKGTPQQIIERICFKKGRTIQGKKAVSDFKTILAFEKLSIALTKIWCRIVLCAFDSVGRISVDDCVEILKTDLDTLCTEKLIENLLNQEGYRHIRDSFHGFAFNRFISKYISMNESLYKYFVYDLIEYHSQVMANRNSGIWLFEDGDEIIANSGYDYAKSNKNVIWMHNYKIDNIVKLVKDTGWKDNGGIY